MSLSAARESMLPGKGNRVRLGRKSVRSQQGIHGPQLGVLANPASLRTQEAEDCGARLEPGTLEVARQARGPCQRHLQHSLFQAAFLRHPFPFCHSAHHSLFLEACWLAFSLSQLTLPNHPLI